MLRCASLLSHANAPSLQPGEQRPAPGSELESEGQALADERERGWNAGAGAAPLWHP